MFDVMTMLNMLEQTNLIKVIFVVIIVFTMGKIRGIFLDDLVNKIKIPKYQGLEKRLKWIIFVLSALAISFIISLFYSIVTKEFNNIVVFSFANWFFSWIFHDAIKNLLLKGQENEKNN